MRNSECIIYVLVNLLEQPPHHVLSLFNLELSARNLIQLSDGADEVCYVLLDNRLLHVFLCYELKVLPRQKLGVEAVPCEHLEPRASVLLLRLFGPQTHARYKVQPVLV